MLVRLALTLFVSWGFPAIVLADDPTLQVGGAGLPSEVSDPVRALLAEDSLSLSVGGSPSAHFWLRTELQQARAASSELGVNLGQIEAGSLVGVVQLVSPWKDYKENPIGPGTYTLRYLVMPADGNHMGVAPYRDFLLLVPAKDDANPAQLFSFDDLVAASVGATGVPHPAVMAVFPIWESVSAPAVVQNEMGQWSLALKLADQVFGLVIEGHGEI